MTIFFNYTSELRTFFESLPANSDQSLSHAKTIENGRAKLFDFDYPVFDEDYRKVFETHFIRRFYLRQIGFESFGLFKFQLETWLIINMPYFNKMFESELLKYDPLTNSKMDMQHTKKNDKTQKDTRDVVDSKSLDGTTVSSANRIGKTTNENEASITGNSDNTQTKDESGTLSDDNFNRQLESNNPDSRLSISANDGEGVIEYASSIKENNENNSKTTQVNGTNTDTQTSQVDSNENSTTNINENLTDNNTTNIIQNDTKKDTNVSTINDIEDFVQSRVGKIGVQTFSKLVQEYRSSLLRIENQIFDEMNQLFMLVY